VLPSAAAVTVNAGVGTAGQSPVTETFGAGISFSLTGNAAFTDNDNNSGFQGGSNLIINGNVMMGAFTLSANGNTGASPTGFGIVFNGVVSGASGINVAGQVTLAGANNYMGNTAISGDARVNVTNNSGLGASTNTTTIAAGFSLLMLDNVSVTQASLTLGKGDDLTGAGSNGGSNGTDVFNGNIVLSNTANANEFIFDAVGTSLKINGVVSGGSATNTLNFSGTGGNAPDLIELAQNDTYTGNTGVFLPGTLQIDAPSALGAGAGATTTVRSGSTLLLDFNGILQDAANNPETLTLNDTGDNGLGALQVLGGASPTIAGTVTLNTNTTIGVGAGTLTFAAAIIGAHNLTFDDDTPGQGTIVLHTANSYNDTDVQSGVILEIQNAGALSTGTVTIDDGATLQDGVPGGSTIANAITFGPGSNGATLQVLTEAGDPRTDTFSAQEQLENAKSTILVPVFDTANFTGKLTGGAVTGNLVVNNVGATPNTGTVELSNTAGSNAYGNTTALAGTLLLNATGTNVVAIPGGTPQAPTTFTIGGSPVQAGFETPSVEVRLSGQDNEISPNAAIVINPRGLLDLNGLNQATTPVLTLTGGALIDFNGGATFTLGAGLTAISATIQVGGGPVSVASVIGVISKQFKLSLNDTTQTFTVDPGPTNTGAADGTFDLDVEATIVDGATVPPATAGAVIKAGTGTMRLDATNTYSGTTAVDAGVLIANNNSALGRSTGTTATGTTVANNASLELTGDTSIDGEALTLDGVGALGAGLGTVAAPHPGELFAISGTGGFGGPITLAATSTIGGNVGTTLNLINLLSGAGGLDVVGGGITNLAASTTQATAAAGNNSYGGATRVQWGKLELDQVVTVGAVTTPAIAVPTALTIGGFTDTNGLLFPATVQVDQSNEISNTVPVTIDQRGKLDVQTHSQTIGGALSLTAGTITGSGSGTVSLAPGTVTATSAQAGNPLVPTTSSISVPNLRLNGDVTFAVAAGGVNAATDLDVSSSIQNGTSAGSITLRGTAASVTQFDNTTASTFSGGTTLDAGLLELAGTPVVAIPGPLTIGSGTGATLDATVRLLTTSKIATTAAVKVNGDGTLDLNNNSDTIGSLTLNGASVTLSGATIGLNGPIVATPAAAAAIIAAPGTVDLQGTTLGTPQFITVNGTAAGNPGLIINAAVTDGGITKLGAGPLTLNGGGNYNLATNVNAGPVFVNGSQPLSPVFIGSGGTLAGNGTTGAVTANNGSFVNPGQATGTTAILDTSANVTLESGSTYQADLDGTSPGSGFDQLNVNGNVSLVGGPTLAPNFATTFAAGTTFTIVQATGTVSGTFDVVNLADNLVPLPDSSTTPHPVTLLSGQTIEAFYGSGPVGPNAVMLEVIASTSVTAVTSSTGGTSVFEQPVTFDATVTFNSGVTTLPGGTVTFSVDGQPELALPLNPATFVPGSGSTPATDTVSFTANALTVTSGTPHVVTAIYSGGPAFSQSTGTLSGGQTVNKAGTTTALQINASSSAFGQPVTFTATVTVKVSSAGVPTTPAGFVTFTEVLTGQTLGTVGVTGGMAAFTTTSLSASRHNVTATYTGDVNFSTSSTATPTAVTIGTPNQILVNSLFRDLLGRDADPVGLANFAGQLDGGAGRQAVVNQILGSQEHLQDAVDQIYEHDLNRHADQSGLSSALKALHGGASMDVVAAGVLGSPEFLAMHGGNASFVDALYQAALGRAADSASSGFVDALNGGASRTAVAMAVLASLEYHTKLVDLPPGLSNALRGGVNGMVFGYYQHFLGRNAVGSEGSGFVNALQSGGLSDQQVIAVFLASQEYATLHGG
jgi:autotransporter-associated beta strand protein